MLALGGVTNPSCTVEAARLEQPQVRECAAGLYLLGFKPAALLRPWHTWRQSTFVYPGARN